MPDIFRQGADTPEDGAKIPFKGYYNWESSQKYFLSADGGYSSLIAPPLLSSVVTRYPFASGCTEGEYSAKALQRVEPSALHAVDKPLNCYVNLLSTLHTVISRIEAALKYKPQFWRKNIKSRPQIEAPLRKNEGVATLNTFLTLSFASFAITVTLISFRN